MDDGPYTIRFVHTNELGFEVIADEFSIIVCNKRMSISPTANAVLDPASDLDLVINGGDCHSYTPNDHIIFGHLKAVHPYFASWSLELQPTSHSHGITPSPHSSTFSATGDSDTPWSLDTEPSADQKLDPCGYTVSLSANTRVILNSQPGIFPSQGQKAVGFAKLP